MIDEKILIEEIESLRMRIGNNNSKEIKLYEKEYKKSILKIIEEQPRVNEWIPVDKRLPKIDEKVLVTYLSYFDKTPMCNGIAYRDEFEDWLWEEDDENVNVEIIAWQPLPKPYVKER